MFLRITNHHSGPLRLYVLDIDPHYYTPLEAAGICHFSALKRLSYYGLAAWYFLPLLLILPFKLYTAVLANRRMDDCFRSRSLPLRPIPPGETVGGTGIGPTAEGNNKCELLECPEELSDANDPEPYRHPHRL